MNIVDPIRSREDVNALKRVLNEGKMRNLLLFLLGINTGLRIFDLLALKISDIKGRDCVQIIEKKTNKTKRFPIPKEIQPFITEFVTGKHLNRYLFRSQNPANQLQGYKHIEL